MIVLFDESEREKLKDFRVNARMHGIDVDVETGEEKMETTRESSQKPADMLPFAFKDPKEYEHLSEVEKEELSQKMLKAHKAFLTQKGILRPREPR